MTARLRSDFWVSAYMRRCQREHAPAMLGRRGSPEAGAIFIKIDCLDGTAALYGPAPQSEITDRGVDRRFNLLHKADRIDAAEADRRLKREIDFDPDLWIIEVEDRAGRAFFDLAA